MVSGAPSYKNYMGRYTNLYEICIQNTKFHQLHNIFLIVKIITLEKEDKGKGKNHVNQCKA